MKPPLELVLGLVESKLQWGAGEFFWRKKLSGRLQSNPGQSSITKPLINSFKQIDAQIVTPSGQTSATLRADNSRLMLTP